MADINKEASWVTARLLELGNATNDGVNVLITDANIQYYNAGGLANTLGINKGGTGATDATGARTNLGVPSTGDVTAAINTAVAPKADKVTGATSGNFAGLDANGDLTDSGSKASDFIPALASDVTPGNVAVIGSNQNIIDGGFKATASFPVGSASGGIASFTDGADNLPIKSMTVDIQPVQAGNGDPSPTNIRPISGWTGEKLYHGDEKVVIIGGEVLDVTVTGVHIHRYENGYIRIYGKSTAITSRGFTGFTATQTSYYFSGFPTLSGYLYWFIYDNDTAQRVGDLRRTLSGEINEFVTGHSYTIAIRVNGANQSADVAFMPVISTVPTEPKVYEIEFPDSAGTVYGGSLTVHEDGTGTLTVDRKGITLTKDSDWSMLSAGKFFVNNCTNNAVTGSRLAEYISNLYPFAGNGQTNSSNVSTDKRFYGQLSQNRIWVYDSSFTTLEAWETELATTPLTCVYPIATPVVYQLTAPQVCTLLGLNNIWSDTGDISVEYHADPTIYVEQKTKAIKQSLAYVQDDLTAVQPYVVNDLVYVGDTLYIVTSAISQGATMTPNTNCSETTLNAVIKSLR